MSITSIDFNVSFAFSSFAFYTHFRTTFALSPFLILYMFTFALSHLELPGPGPAVFFDDRPGPAMLASVLFYRPGRPGRPKVGLAVDFGRYRPRPCPALFVFA